MINNKIYELAQAMMAGFDSSGQFNHNPTKGETREDLLIDYLERLLPFKYAITRGIIISANSRLSDSTSQSKQQDIIIYDRLNCPRLFKPTRDKEEAQNCIPIESVLCTIEVKSNLTSEEINDAYEKYASVNTLARHYLSPLGFSIEGGNYSPISFLFGYTSKISLQSIAEQMKKIRQQPTGTPHLLGIIALDKGIVCYASKRDISKLDLLATDPNVMEVQMQRDDYHETLLAFSSLLINSLNQIVIRTPDLEYYMKNSELRLSHEIFISNDFVDDKTYRVKRGKSICVKKEFEGNILMSRIYKPGMSDMDFLIDDDIAQIYLFGMFKLYKSGALDSDFAKPIEALKLDDSFEEIIDKYLSGEHVTISPDIILNFKRHMIIASLKMANKLETNGADAKINEAVIPVIEKGDDQFIANFVSFMKTVRTKQKEELSDPIK